MPAVAQPPTARGSPFRLAPPVLRPTSTLDSQSTDPRMATPLCIVGAAKTAVPFWKQWPFCVGVALALAFGGIAVVGAFFDKMDKQEKENLIREVRDIRTRYGFKTVEEQKELARQYVQDNIDRLLGGDKAAKEVVGSIPAMDYAFGGRVDTARIGAVTQKYDEHGEAKDCVINVQVISSGSGGSIANPRPLSYVADLWVEVRAGKINALNASLPKGSY